MPTYKGTTSADFIKGSNLTDVIEGFDGSDSLYGEGGVDTLDFGAIDANTKLSGNQAFFLKSGGAFGGWAGEVIWKPEMGTDGKTQTLLMADVNGDKVADMTIEFAGVHAFTSADFIF